MSGEAVIDVIREDESLTHVEKRKAMTNQPWA